MRCRQWHGSWIIAVDVANPMLAAADTVVDTASPVPVAADVVVDMASPVLIVAAHSVVPAAHLMVPNVAAHSEVPVVHPVAVSVVPGAKTIP